MKEKQKSEIWGTKQKVYKVRSGARENGQREGRKKKCTARIWDGNRSIEVSQVLQNVSYAAIINANICK